MTKLPRRHLLHLAAGSRRAAGRVADCNPRHARVFPTNGLQWITSSCRRRTMTVGAALDHEGRYRIRQKIRCNSLIAGAATTCRCDNVIAFVNVRLERITDSSQTPSQARKVPLPEAS